VQVPNDILNSSPVMITLQLIKSMLFSLNKSKEDIYDVHAPELSFAPRSSFFHALLTISCPTPSHCIQVAE
jgi:hypothetical protein